MHYLSAAGIPRLREGEHVSRNEQVRLERPVLAARDRPAGFGARRRRAEAGRVARLGDAPVTAGGERRVQPLQGGQRRAAAWANLPGVPVPPSPARGRRGDRIAAFLFTYPERAHLPPNASNKVLWAVAGRAKAGTLRIGARLLGRRARPLEIRLMAGDESARSSARARATRRPAAGG